VLALTNVVDFLAYEFAGLRRWRFAGTLVLTSSPYGRLLRHAALLSTGRGNLDASVDRAFDQNLCSV